MAKQSIADRQKRLDEGCCPIHGIPMYQVSQWYYIVESPPTMGVPMTEAEILSSMKMRNAYTIVQCTRKDCGVQAKESEPFGPAELTEEWAHLLEEAE